MGWVVGCVDAEELELPEAGLPESAGLLEEPGCCASRLFCFSAAWPVVAGLVAAWLAGASSFPTAEPVLGFVAVLVAGSWSAWSALVWARVRRSVGRMETGSVSA